MALRTTKIKVLNLMFIPDAPFLDWPSSKTRNSVYELSNSYE
jgi:hypothetical protein